MTHAMNANEATTAFSTHKINWKRLRILLRKTWAANIAARRLRTGDARKKVLEDTSLSSTNSITEPVKGKCERPKGHKALVVASRGKYEVREGFPVPYVGEHEVLIRTHFVGLNPIDWKSVDYNFCLPSFPWVTGREMSGEVVQVGGHVHGLRPGDKVWTSTYYRDVRAGCFQEYVVVPSHTVLTIPDQVSMEAAACLGVAALTACMTLWKWFKVPIPSISAAASNQQSSAQEWVLIWGGSSVTGQFATQLAVLSGLKVITVTSQQTAELSKRLGAHYVVIRDGKTTEQMVQQIRSVAGDRITKAIDLVGAETAAIALEAISKTLPVEFAPLAMMSPEQQIPPGVTIHIVEMKKFVLDPSSAQYARELNRLLSEEKLQFPSIRILDGGFEDIIRGLDTLKRGNMGGEKIVVQL